MYYNSPNMSRYVDNILKYRPHIIAFYLLLVLVMGLLYTPKFLSSDALFWLKNSKQFAQTESKAFETHHISKLVVEIKHFDEDSHQALKNLHTALEGLEGVDKVYSLFSNDFVETKKSAKTSDMPTVVHAGDLEAHTLRKLLKNKQHSYGNVVEDDFKTFYYFIYGEKVINVDSIDIPGSYHYDRNTGTVDSNYLLAFIGLILLLTFVMFRLLFRSHIAFFSATLVVFLSTVLTFTTIVSLTGIDTIHISMLFISISISLVEFLYFYYRWHVSQYKHNIHAALQKLLTKNMLPAMWTSILTFLSLGSLVFIDSDIIKLLSLSVILSSFISYILNLTFLPAFLSYFEIEHAHIPYAKLVYILTFKEMHYKKSFLIAFLGVMYLLLAIGAYLIYGESNNFFKLHVKNEQVELKIPYNKLDLPFVQTIDTFTKAIEKRFEDEVIDDVISLSAIIHSLNDANTQTEALDEQALAQAFFYMDLYNLNDKYFDDTAINLIISLSDINKVELIEWLLKYEGIKFYFIDQATLIGSAKHHQTILLASSLLVALILIGLITGWIFRSKAMIFVGFTVNIIPIILFETIVRLLEIPLSIEMLIATTISLGLASDATIHFAFKYFRLRYFGRSRKHSLEKMYFYSAIPVIIGSLILITVFLMLYFSQIHFLELIGLYSASLISLSLITDLFMLPVMLLFIDRFQNWSEFN